MKTPAPGIYPDVPYDDYSAWEAVRSTVLKAYPPSAKMWHEMTNARPDTPAFMLGRAVHTAVLEPDKFQGLYAVAPKVDRRTKAGKATWAAFQMANATKDILTQQDWDKCTAMNSAVWQHPAARQLLEDAVGFEVSAIAELEGVLCKVRIDLLTTSSGRTHVVDLKTTQNAKPDTWGFGKSAAEFSYHVSAALYLDVLDAIQPADRSFTFICVEKGRKSDPTPLHLVSVMELDAHAIEAGRVAYQKALQVYSKGVRTGEWPGYSTMIEPLSLPDWALRDADFSVEAQLEAFNL